MSQRTMLYCRFSMFIQIIQQYLISHVKIIVLVALAGKLRSELPVPPLQ
jgi:hypothetical protein